jgi:superfamily II DNA or RNA helicase
MQGDTTVKRKKALLRERLYVNAEFVTESMLHEFTEQIEVGEDAHTKEKIYQYYNHYVYNQTTPDEGMYVFNRGDMNKVRTVFSDFEIIDERLSVEMRHPLKIKFQTGYDWRPYQPDAIDAFLQSDHGLLKAPPRSGKTLMIAATICLEREKTIVFAHQTDLLEQLLDTFYNFTNLEELEEKTGQKIVGFAKDVSDFDELDVVLCTKQTFDHLNNKTLQVAVQRMFGSVYIDEAHFLGADAYSRLINRFQAKSRRGVTATPIRKDGLDVIIKGVVGPVVYEIPVEQVPQVPMSVERINTGIKISYKTFSKILTALSESETRNKLIVERMVQDVQDGRTIVSVTDRKEHQDKLQKLLREKGIACELFNGRTNNRKIRKEILGKIRSKQVPILIAMRNMTTGLDIPSADVFYNLLPSANSVKDGIHEGEGGYEQQCTRVRTEYEGKKHCWVRDFVDNFGTAYACWNARKKTYNKIGARILKDKEEEQSEYNKFLAMNDSGWSMESTKTIVYGDVVTAEETESPPKVIKDKNGDGEQLPLPLTERPASDATEG